MAIFSVRFSFISRSKGSSCVASGAYISGTKLCNERDGKISDFSKKNDVIFSKIYAPEGAPDWVLDRAQLWNKVELFEDSLINHRFRGNYKDPNKSQRSEEARLKALDNATTGWRETIALPRELTKEQNIAWLGDYIKKHFTKNGIIVDCAIHGNKGNPHAHLTVPLRRLEGDTFSKIKETSKRKEGNIFDKKGVVEGRRIKAELMNHSLEAAGFRDRVSHLSYKDRGITKLPTKHEGWYARNLESRGESSYLIDDNKKTRQINLYNYIKNPQAFILDFSHQKVVFTDSDLKKEAFEVAQGDESAYKALLSGVSKVSLPKEAISVANDAIQIDSSQLQKFFEELKKDPLLEKDLITLQDLSVGKPDAFVPLAEEEILKTIERLAASALAPSEEDAARIQNRRQSLATCLMEGSTQRREDRLEDYLLNPGVLSNDLAKQKVVFTLKDVQDALYGLVGENETCYRLLKAHCEGEELPSRNLRAANEDLVMDSSELHQQISYFVEQVAGEVIENDRTVALGKNIGQQEIYTSVDQQAKEEEILNAVDRLEQNHKAGALKSLSVKNLIYKQEAEEQLKNPSFAYSTEQRDAIRYLTSGGHLKVLTGRAGTGKSTVLKPVARAFEAQGYEVIGLAFQGKVADALNREVGIKSSTIESIALQWQKYDKTMAAIQGGLSGEELNKAKKTLQYTFGDQLHKKSVVLLDEGSMVGQGDYAKILKRVEEAGAKLIIVKDDAQIKALFGADISAAISDKVEGKVLKAVQRQRVDWMKEASAHLNEHRVEQGLYEYENRGHVRYLKDLQSTKQEMVKGFVTSYLAHPEQSQAMLAFKNVDVEDLNCSVFKKLQEEGKLGDSFEFGIKEKKEFAVGAEVVFTKNDRRGKLVKTDEGVAKEGVNNGTFGTIVDYDPSTKNLFIKLKGDGRVVKLNESLRDNFGHNYEHLSLGYALTVNKSQGETFDKVYALFDTLYRANAFLVALTRHREDFILYASSEQVSHFRDIASFVGASEYKAVSSNYKVKQGEELAFELVATYKHVSSELADTYQRLESYSPEGEGKTLNDHPLWVVTEQLKSSRNALALEILDRWKVCLPFVRQANIRVEVLEEQAGVRDRLLTYGEGLAVQRIEDYYHKSRLTREYWEGIQLTKPGALAQEHYLYQDYIKLRDQRDDLAVEIADQAKLHKPFFKVTYVKNEAGEIDHYTSYRGTVFERRPPTFQTACKQADAYQNRQREEYFKDVLLGDRKELFAKLTVYKEAVRKANHCYYDLKQVETSSEEEKSKQGLFVKSDLQALEKTSAAQRDLSAYEVVEWLCSEDGDGTHGQLIDKLGINQEKLLRHAVQGEVRTRVTQWQEAKTIDQRLTLSSQLFKTVFGEEKKTCNKPLYGFLKSLEVDIGRIQFEHAYSLHVEETGKQKFETVDEVRSAYHTLDTYNKAHRLAADKWHILKSEVHTQVKALQDQQVKAFNENGLSSGLILEALEQEALQKYNQKVVGPQVFASVNAQLREIVNGRGYQESLPVDIVQRQTILNKWQKSLRKDRSAYVEVYKDIHGHEEGWEYAYKKKLPLADKILKLNGTVINVAFGEHMHNRLVKEQSDYQAAEKVEAYAKSQGDLKVSLASGLLKKLEDESNSGINTLKRSIKSNGVSFESIHLYGLIESHKASLSEEKVAPVIHQLEAYLSAKERFSELWKMRGEAVESSVAEVRDAFEISREKLVSTLEAKAYHPSYEYRIDKLIDKVRRFVETNELQTKEDHSRGYSEKAYELAFKEIEGLNEDRKIGLSDSEKQALTHSLFDLKEKREAIYKAQFAAMEAHKFEEGDTKELFSAAGERNKAAHKLMTSFLGENINSATHWSVSQLKDYAKRYAEKEEKLAAQAKSKESTVWSEIKTDEGLKFSPAQLEERAKYRKELEIKELVEEITRSVDVQSLAEDLLRGYGLSFNKKDSKGPELRFGRTGKFSITLKSGFILWNNFETGEGGNLFKLVETYRGGTFNEQVAYMKPFCHGSAGLQIEKFLKGEKISTLNDEDLRKKHEALDKQRAEQEKVWQEAQEKEARAKIADVQELYKSKRPLKGTQAEVYLKETRKLEQSSQVSADCELAFIPKGTRFKYGDKNIQLYHDSLASFARNKQGEVNAVQLISLENNKKANIDVNKRTYGVNKGCSVKLQTGEGVLFLAEGVETALSIKEIGMNGQIEASLGISNIAKRDVSGFEKLVICADNDDDKPKSRTRETIEKAKAIYEAQGIEVVIVRPDHPGDFNDVLQQGGVEAVKKYFEEQNIKIEGVNSHSKAEEIETKEDNPVKEPLPSALEEVKQPYKEKEETAQLGDHAQETSEVYSRADAIKAAYAAEMLIKEGEEPESIKDFLRKAREEMFGEPSKEENDRGIDWD